MTQTLKKNTIFIKKKNTIFPRALVRSSDIESPFGDTWNLFLFLLQSRLFGLLLPLGPSFLSVLHTIFFLPWILKCSQALSFWLQNILPFTIRSRLETIDSQSLYFYLVTSVHDLASWISETKRSHEASVPLSSYHQISQPGRISPVLTVPTLYNIDVYLSHKNKDQSFHF